MFLIIYLPLPALFDIVYLLKFFQEYLFDDVWKKVSRINVQRKSKDNWTIWSSMRILDIY